MKSLSNGVVMASVIGQAIATVCPITHFADVDGNPVSFFNNLMVAAVVDKYYVPVTAPTTALALYNEIFGATGTHPITALTTPKINSHLATHLQTASSCGVCALGFYQSVVASIGASDCVSNMSGSLQYQYDGWSSINSYANHVSDFQTFTCVSKIQNSIDKFNACANNGYDIRTGAYSTICTNQDDFTNVDAKVGAYKIMMDYALKNNLSTSSPMPSDFTDAYTTLPCRSCFDSFVTSINGSYSTLWNVGSAAGPCAGTGTSPNFAPEYYNEVTCLNPSSAVTTALEQFQVCAGIYNSLYTAQRFPPTSDGALLFNEIIKSYQAIATCSSTTDAGAVSSTGPTGTNLLSITPLAPWTTCITGSAHGASAALTMATASDIACFKQFGHAIYTFPAPTSGAATDCGLTTGNGPFTGTLDGTTPGCLADLARNTTNPVSSSFVASSVDSALMTLYKCSGVQLDVVSPMCSGSQIAQIDAKYKSFVPLVEIAVAAGSNQIQAGKNVLGDTDLMGAIGELPCSSCYSRFAALLSKEFTQDSLALCQNPYSAECMGSSSVAAALVDFHSCASFSLTNDSPYECSADEWTILQNTNTVYNTFDLIVPNNSQTLVEAQYDYGLMIQAVKTANPTLAFRCDHCFNQMLVDFHALSNDAINACNDDITSPACYSGATIAMSKFQDCSGYALDWTDSTTTAAPGTATTTTAAPDTTTIAATTSTAAPETTKSSGSVLVPILGTGFAVLALTALLL